MKHKILLLPNGQKDPGYLFTKKVVDVLRPYAPVLYAEETVASMLGEGVEGYAPDAFPKDVTLLLVLGGDGSMLHAAALALKQDIPMLGVNLGRLGYLASLEPEDVGELSRLFTDEPVEKQRMTLDVSCRDGNGNERFLGKVLNEVTLDGGGHLADMRLWEGENFLDYRADGLIVCTPTGSTAYSLSAGGPVIDEAMEAVCVTPICPRSFFSRSLLFPADTVLRAENVGTRAEGLHVSLDGCTEFTLGRGESITVRRSAQSLRIVFLKPRALLDVLQRKMNMQNF